MGNLLALAVTLPPNPRSINCNSVRRILEQDGNVGPSFLVDISIPRVSLSHKHCAIHSNDFDYDVQYTPYYYSSPCILRAFGLIHGEFSGIDNLVQFDGLTCHHCYKLRLLHWHSIQVACCGNAQRGHLLPSILLPTRTDVGCSHQRTQSGY